MNIEIIVPLAGPDYVDVKGKIKGENSSGEVVFLREILMSRRWFDDKNNYFTFVFIDQEATRRLYNEQIKEWFTHTRAIFISNGTSGAALTALSAISNISDFSAPLVIDLADIRYDCCSDPIEMIRHESVSAVGLTFKSTSPLYSYLLFDKDENFILSKEKEVISSNASVGTYMFKSSLVYVSSLVKVMERYNDYQYNDFMYVCPVFNGVKELGMFVKNFPVENILDGNSAK